MTILTTRSIGMHYEERALQYLQQQGLQLVERNFLLSSTHFRGEIDLIMQLAKQLIFVEVRQRRQQQFGDAAASINFAKQQRLVKTAQYYLQRFRRPPACRFDVIAINGEQIEWIKNAFELC